MARIMFYTCIKTRVRDQESLVKALVQRGDEVLFVNQTENKYLPKICQSVGAAYKTVRPPKLKWSGFRVLYYVADLLVRSWTNKVDTIFSHLEPANFIAVLVQFLVPAKVVIVRHHHDLAERAGFGADFSYRMTYGWARSIIAVSRASREYAIKKEGVHPERIYHINLGYDFSVFGSPNYEKAESLRKVNGEAIKLVTVGRLDPYKRPELSIQVAHRLKARGLKVRLWLLGDGEDLDKLKQLVVAWQLVNEVEFVGYSDEVLTYLTASDWILHPSISEASCVVLKEAGLVQRPVIACRSVGDFDDVVINGVNSVLVDSAKFTTEAVDSIIQYSDPLQRKKFGNALHDRIISTFSIDRVLTKYDRFCVS